MVLAESFDIFGCLIFIVILVLGCVMLKKAKKKTFKIIGGLLVAIGIIGTLADGYIVIKTFVIG